MRANNAVLKLLCGGGGLFEDGSLCRDAGVGTDCTGVSCKVNLKNKPNLFLDDDNHYPTRATSDAESIKITFVPLKRANSMKKPLRVQKAQDFTRVVKLSRLESRLKSL